MTVNNELLFKGNNRDVVEMQEIQALPLTVCTTLMKKATLHFSPKNMHVFPTVLSITSDYFLKEH